MWQKINFPCKECHYGDINEIESLGFAVPVFYQPIASDGC